MYEERKKKTTPKNPHAANSLSVPETKGKPMEAKVLPNSTFAFLILILFIYYFFKKIIFLLSFPYY
jgi:hypothetical protein